MKLSEGLCIINGEVHEKLLIFIRAYNGIRDLQIHSSIEIPQCIKDIVKVEISDFQMESFKLIYNGFKGTN